MAKLVSSTYAEALFETGLEEGTIDALYEEAVTFLDLLKENPDFSRLMNHPKILREDKEEIMESVFKGRMSNEFTGFLKIIVTNKRYGEIDQIISDFIRKVKEYKKIGVAYVSTPLELSDRQKEAVKSKLLDTTDYVSMEMNYSIDKSLIGGMVIRIGDRVVDSSIRTKLDELKKELNGIQLSSADA
ncbi:MAG: F0F1 ATP synthase subunit delta [Lachnospiraceae bacterium]|nr:F0F1 ATP synthase subunit delta [Lachnospiraceae bacterium]